MAIIKPTVGQSRDTWGTTLNTALDSLQSQIDTLTTQTANMITESPQARGFINWNYRPDMVSAGTAPGSGFILMMRVNVPATATVSNIWLGLAASGATLTSGQNFVGLYNAAGTRLGVSADLTTRWATDLDLQSYALTAPVGVTAGYYYVALVSNATTRPSFWRVISNASAANTINAGLTVTNQAYGYYPTVNSSLPSTLDYSTRTPLTANPWCALS